MFNIASANVIYAVFLHFNINWLPSNKDMWCSRCPLNAFRCDCLQLQFDCCLFPAQQHPESRLHKDNDDNATGNMHSGLIWQGHALNAISTTRRRFGRYFKLCETAGKTITIGPLCDILRVCSCVCFMIVYTKHAIDFNADCFSVGNHIVISIIVETRVCSMLY